MCIANSFKHFGGGQSVVTYCNASREALEARSQRVDKDGGGRMQRMAWPQ